MNPESKYRVEYQGKPVDLERELVVRIAETGREQIKRRRRHNLSVYYLKNDKLIEVKPDKTEISIKDIKSRWITLESDKRSIVIK